MAKETKPTGDELLLLMVLLTDFKARQLSASHLISGYDGMKVEGLRAEILSEGTIDEVDFELALTSLEAKGLAHTGPVEVTPGRSVAGYLVMPSIISRREWIRLSQKGYETGRAAARADTNRRSRIDPSVSLHGNFSGAQIAFGNNNRQTVTYPDAAWFTAARASIQSSFQDASTLATLTGEIDELHRAAESKTGFAERAKTTLSVVASAFQIAGLTLPTLFHLLQQYVR
jgi:hypothetical protein